MTTDQEHQAQDPTSNEPTSDTPAEGEEMVYADDAIIGVAFKWSLIVIVIIGALVGGILFLTRETGDDTVVQNDDPIVGPAPLDQTADQMPDVLFTDLTTGSGIDFVHDSGAAGDKFLPETMGAGVAVLDYDLDGDPDLLFVNGHAWEDADAASTMRLYQNDGTGQFDDVTTEAGLDIMVYGHGAAVGDIDHDGDPDLFIAALGENLLLRNDDGRFVDATASSGLGGPATAWGTSAGFFDMENDGDLDLFVCNYVEWSKEIDVQLAFSLNGTDRAYGPPKQYRGTHCLLYRNTGDGTFEDVSATSGIQVTNPATDEPMGKSLAVTFADIDRDSRIDIIVANDTVANFLFRNLGDGTFEEIGGMAGTAYTAMGTPTGAMGQDIGDYRNDGALAIAIGNFANESSSFYVQQPRDPWIFADMASSEGIGSPSRRYLSFGLFFFDYDLDGRLDLLQANGHLEDEINEIQESQHYHQPAQLFWNRGSGGQACYAMVPMAETGDLSTPIVGRGAAYADLDADGDLDVILTQTGAPPLVLRNEQSLGHHWLRVHLRGMRSNSEAIGAWVVVEAGGITQRRQVMPSRSYLSQVETIVTFGLGEVDQVDRVQVIWPDGRTQDVQIDGVDRLITVVEAES